MTDIRLSPTPPTGSEQLNNDDGPTATQALRPPKDAVAAAWIVASLEDVAGRSLLD
ncbi:MAG: hypothetical protein JWR32_3417 [Mycobacterium sp.]|jgi:hypothetical protein|nr:hypothetical protein [Mycobacterium sp.]